MRSLTSVDDSEYVDYSATSSSSDVDSSWQRFIVVAVTALISGGIILSNIVNLVVLVSASAAMPWATQLFLIILSSSDLLVGLIAFAPAVLPAATNRWTYGDWRLTLSR